MTSPSDNSHGTESLRESCIRESLKIIARDGVGSLSIREVSRRLGVSHGAPYRHFANRNALIAEIAVQGMCVLQDYLMRGIDFETASPKDNFIRFCLNYIDFAQEQHDYFQLILWTDLPDAREFPALKNEADNMYTLFSRLITRIDMDKGESHKKAGPKLTLRVFGTVHGLASLIASRKLAVLDYKKVQLDAYALEIVEELYESLPVRG